jgi:hypothetical protein
MVKALSTERYAPVLTNVRDRLMTPTGPRPRFLCNARGSPFCGDAIVNTPATVKGYAALSRGAPLLPFEG